MIINNIGINFAGGGGGKSAVLETKDYAITANGTTSIEPSEGVDGISGGTINVEVQPSLTSVTYTENGTYTPGSGVDGFNSVTVAVPETSENRLNTLMKNQLTAVTQSDLSGVTALSESSFVGKTSIQKVNLPPTLTTINKAAFSGCTNLTTINTDNVTYFGESVFTNCYNLTGITFNSECKQQIPSYFLQGCRSLTGNLDVYFGAIEGTNVFSGCTGLTSITCLNNITLVSRYSYQNPYAGCNHMEYLDFTHNYTIPLLGYDTCFSAFTPNYEIKVPQTLLQLWKSTGSWSASSIVDHIVGYPDFYNKSKFKYTTTGNDTTVTYNNWQATYLGKEYDASTGGTVEFYGPKVVIPNKCFSGQTSLITDVEFEGNFTVGDLAFYQCHKITDLDLSGVTLGTGSAGGAFQNCTGLTSVTLTDSAIGYQCFAACSNLQKVSLLGNTTFTNVTPFHSDTGITEIVLGDSYTDVTDVYNKGLLNVSPSLKSVTFGSNIQSLLVNGNSQRLFNQNAMVNTLVFKSLVPPTYGNTGYPTFEYGLDYTGTVYCPAESLQAYTEWKNAYSQTSYFTNYWGISPLPTS